MTLRAAEGLPLRVCVFARVILSQNFLAQATVGSTHSIIGR